MTSPRARPSPVGAAGATPPASKIRSALVVVRILRKLAACALPRPSATASAKFANSTVNHSQMISCKVSLESTARPRARSRMYSRLTSAVPTSTTNMTGFFIMSRGFNFLNESPMAGLMMDASNSEREFSLDFTMASSMNGGGSDQLEVLDDRTEREHWEESEGADQQDGAGQERDEQATTNWKARRAGWGALLLRHVACNGEHGDDG